MPEAEPSGQQQGSFEVDVRFSELKMRAEFPARTVEELDLVVREFAERVARLERELRELRGQLEAFTRGARGVLDEDVDDDDDDDADDAPRTVS